MHVYNFDRTKSCATPGVVAAAEDGLSSRRNAGYLYFIRFRPCLPLDTCKIRTAHCLSNQLKSKFLLDLADNVVCARERFYHLLAFFSSSYRVIAFLEKIIQRVSAVHIFKQLTLHLILDVPGSVSSTVQAFYPKTLTGQVGA